jgi:hypothetical protein
MIGFTAQRLMEREVGGKTGAGYGEKSAERLSQRNCYRGTGCGRPAPGRWSCVSPSCAREATSPGFWSRVGWPRRRSRRWCIRCQERINYRISLDICDTIIFDMSMLPKNGRRSRDNISHQLKSLTVPASRSKAFRKMAADALRAGRKARPGNDRDAHFSMAASYKSLAHDNEWMYGERQRSYKRRQASKKPESG